MCLPEKLGINETNDTRRAAGESALVHVRERSLELGLDISMF